MAIVERMKEVMGITPAHTDDEMQEVHDKASATATTAWFKMVIEQHLEIEEGFAAVMSAKTATTRGTAQKRLMAIVTGHSLAEEVIVYPFMKIDTSTMSAHHVYNEHAMVKIGFVELDKIADKLSQEYDDKLEELRCALAHHMVEEERDFFPELQSKATSAENTKISQHYKMEFERYMQADRALTSISTKP